MLFAENSIGPILGNSFESNQEKFNIILNQMDPARARTWIASFTDHAWLELAFVPGHPG